MYIEVTSQVAINDFLEKVHFLHDALLREVALISRGYVDSNLSMYEDAAPSDARLIFQTQFEDVPVIDVVFESIIELRIMGNSEFEPGGTYSESEVEFFLHEPNSRVTSVIVAKTMKYRILEKDRLGRALYIAREIPVGDLIACILLENGWIQCPSCSNSWKRGDEDTEPEVYRCPSCGALCGAP